MRNRELDDLAGYMQRILDILAEGRKSLGQVEATQWKALALARWDMLRALDGYVAFKQHRVLEPLMRVRAGDAFDRAAWLSAEDRSLKEAYDAFVERWSLTSPLSVDGHYRREALAMAEKIERQVIADVQELEALLDESGHAPGAGDRNPAEGIGGDEP